MKIIFFTALCLFWFSGSAQKPDTFKNVQQVIPAIQLEVRYFSTDNFVGRRIDGYKAPKVYVTNETVEALKNVQEQLERKGLGLKLFDGYRPQKAVDHFVRWAKVLGDTIMKNKYYPKVAKSQLFNEGYIASKSGHTRGSTIDVTIVELKTGKELDMGGLWDLFDPISWVENITINPEQQRNRKLLQQVMLNNGFQNYAQEWWHFTLKNEPFPNTYFDFNIE